MPEREASTASEKEPSSSFSSLRTPQNHESGWLMAFKALFWLLLLPSVILLLLKWLMPA